jgi:uncharacterized protein YigA (DUF484 family)
MRVSSERTRAKELEKKVSTLTEKVEEKRRKRYPTARHAQQLHKANEACTTLYKLMQYVSFYS